MRLKDYLASYAESSHKGIVRGVAEWLEEQARLARGSGDAAERVRAGCFEIAARELHGQRIECWP